MKIALKSMANQRFVCAESEGNQPLIANREKAQSWETFEVFLVNADGTLTAIPQGAQGAATTPVPTPSTTLPIPGAEPTGAYVAAVKARLEDMHVDTSGAAGAFNVTKWVVWGLKATGVGFLIKDTGDNVINWHSKNYSAGRVCYPDGRLYKIMTDVGGANGPQWAENGTVDKSLYSPALDPAL